MKVLFVCRANVIRSQMAAAFYNQLTSSNDADSAGTMVDEPGETLGHRAQDRPASRLVIETMHQAGLDLSAAVRTQLTPQMINQYDMVICMADPQYSPDWLLEASNYHFWQVEDPMAIGLETTTKARDIIKQKVQTLIEAS